MSLTPKNWSTFQHYSDRRPAWIKLHRGLLDDYSYNCLPVASRALAPMLWLLASEYDHGIITASLGEIAYRLRTNEKDLTDALTPLIDKGFFIDDSGLLATCEQVALPEKERETQERREKEKEATGFKKKPVSYSEEFEIFWKQYPRTPVMSKKEAWGAWKRLSEADQQAAIAALPAYKAFLASKPDHPAVHACRFLSQRRFDGFAAEPEPQSNGGWRPGLPTEEELRAKYAAERLRKGCSLEDSPMVQTGMGARETESGLGENSGRKRGTQSLGQILRKNGLVSNVFSGGKEGNNPSMQISRVDEPTDLQRNGEIGE